MRKIAVLSLLFVLGGCTYGFTSNLPLRASLGHKKAISGQVNGHQTASWYAKDGDTTDPWVHTTTANGEHFDENALTAASWKYAFGSMVRVTNISNGKSVIVRCNDRGPSKRLYRKGRTMDLTKAAFAKIAPLSMGIIHIRTELIK